MIRIAHNTSVGICQEHQVLPCVDIGFSNVLIRLVLTHQETHFTLQGNSISRVHGSQPEYIILLHVLDVHVFIGPSLCHIPCQGNGQRFIRGSNTFLAAGENQVVACDIGIICSFCVVDALCGMQADISLCAVIRGVYSAHVDGRMVPFRIGTARHEDIAARLHVKSAIGLNSQRHIALNLEFRQLAVFPYGSDIGSAHIHELLHAFNLLVSGKIRQGNLVGDRVVKGAHCALGRSQSDIILGQDISEPIRLRTATASFINQRVADGVEHHFFRPFEGAFLRIRLIYQVFIFGVRLKISFCIDVLGILVRDSIRFQILVCCGVAKLGIIFVSLIVTVAFCLQRLSFALGKIVETPLVGKVGIIRSLLRGEILIILITARIFLVQRLPLFLGKTVIVGIFIPVCNVGVIRSLILIVICLPLGLRLSVLSSIISRYYIRRIVVAFLLQTRNVCAFISVFATFVLFAVNQAGVDPAMHHFVHAVIRTVFIFLGKRVNEAAV